MEVVTPRSSFNTGYERSSPSTIRNPHVVLPKDALRKIADSFPGLKESSWRGTRSVRQKTLRNIVVESPATCRRVLNRAEPSRAALFPSSMSRGEYRVGPDTWSESLSMRKGPECSSPPFARERAARDFHESRSLPVPWKRGDIFLNDDGKKSTA